MPRREAIEAELEQERRALALRLEVLSGRLTPASLTAEAGDVVSDIAAQAVTAAWTRGTRAAASLAAAAVASTPQHRAQRLPTRALDLGRANHRNHQKEGVPQMTDIDKTAKKLSHKAHDLGEQAKASVDALRARIDDGLDGLPEAAKERVQKARAAAIAAQAEVEARARAATDVVRTTARENPLLVGALAFAAGAAIASLLPRTSVENRTLGAHRDRLFDEAERIYREERERLSAAATEAIEEAGEHLQSRVPASKQPLEELNSASA